MRYLSPLTVLFALSVAAPPTVAGQNYSGLTVTNYQLISQQQVTRNQAAFVYRADLTNTGPAQPSLTAIVTSKIPSIVVTPGQSNLHFPPVLSGGRVTSTNTFTVTVDRSVPSDFSNLVWTFGAPVANAGPDQNVAVGALVTLDGTRTTNPSGIGAVTYDWLFASRPPGTRAVLQGADTPMPTFTADVQGDFVLQLRATNSVGTDTSFVTVHVGPATAQKPTANAGPGQTINQVGATVTLNGSGSTDPGGNPLTYRWSLIVRPAGSAATLSTPNSVTTTFVADKPGTYMAQLIVNNGTLDSDPSTVTITDTNTPPIANPGASQNVTAGATVQLNGSGSTDFDGNPLTYRWSLISVPAGSTATLSNPNIVNPTFVADLAGIYVAQLIVNDGFDDSKPMTVTITAGSAPPQKPTANAGLPISTKHNSLVTLNGSGTDPQGKPLTFRWSLITKPAGSTATLSNPNTPNPTFTADVPGTFVAQLIVNNGTLDSDPSTVQISSTNTAPVANAGPSQTVSAGTKVTLDGTASSDAENDPLTYSWSLSSIPNGSTATLTFANSAHPTFVADVAGPYVAQLVVNDGYLNSSPATVTITAITSGLALSPNPLNLFNLPGTLTVTIGSPAGSSGQVVNLTSFDTTVVTVPPSVTIAPGTTSVSFTVTPAGTGSTTVIASAPGFQPGSTTVNVTQPSLSLSLSSNSVGVSRSVTGTVTLNAPAPASGVSVNLTADRSGIVTIPASVSIAAGSTTGTFTVTGAAPGSANITASAPGYTSRSVGITVGQLGQITLTSNVTVGPSQTLPYGVSLVSPAPSGGVTITLTSSDTSKLTISPTVFIAAGATTPDTPAQITGVNFGTVTVTASASGFTGDSKTVQVAANLSFTPSQLTIGVGGTQNITLTLSGPAPAGGLAVNLSSSNTSAATVPASVTIPQGATTVSVPVTGVNAGQSTTITASSTTSGVVSGTASVSVISGVVISTTTLPNGAVGTPYSTAVTATGGTAPYTFSATGLPAGLSITTGGQITGTPSAPGSFPVTVTVTDSTSPKLTASANLTLVINQPLSITTTSLATANANSAYSATVAATGGTTPYTFTATGLPSGLSISAGGQITGTPTASGSFPVMVTVTDSTSPKLTATANLTLTVNPALAITTTSLPAATNGTPYTATINATGGKAPYTFSATGLPGGLSLSAGGQITGTPTATGNFTPVFTVTDSTTPTPFTSSSTLALSVTAPALVLNTTSLPGGTVNVAYNASLNASGGTAPYSFTATGVPAGLTLNSAGQISGNPTTAGNFTLSVTVTDSSSPAMTKTGNVTLTINPPGLALVTSSLPNGMVGAAYSNSVTASGGTTPYSFSATGVPAGLTFNSAGLLSGTPTASGSFTLTVTVTDAGSPAQTKTGPVTIQIDPSTLVFTTASLPAGTSGTPYSAALTASGGTAPYSFAVTGLPAGLSVSSGGQISGTPSASGSFTLSVTVTDSGSPAQTKTGSVVLNIAPPQLVLTSTSLPNGTVGTAYSAALTASGGTPSYSFAATGIPAGLSVNAAGQISGTPTMAGSFTLSVTVTDSGNPAQTKTGPVTLTIAPSQLVLTSTSLPNGTIGTAYSAQLAASGGTPQYSFSATGVPAGLSVNAAGQVSGTPTSAGNFTLTVTVTDAGNPAQTKTGPVTLTISNTTLVLTTTSLPAGTVGTSYSATLTASGGATPYTFSATGIPAGLSVSTGGQVSGTPTASGNFTLSVTVTDSSNPAQTKTGPVTIQIAPSQLVLTTTSLPAGTAGVSYSAALMASGGTAPYSFAATGVPAGLSVNASGQVSGTPSTPGSYTLNVTVTDAGNPAQTKTGPVTLIINPSPLSITTSSLPNGMAGTQYNNVQINATGGTAPYNFAATGLPPGLSLSPSGQLSGTPTAAGTYSVTITAGDSSNPRQTASANFSVTIAAMSSGPSLTVTGGAIGQNLQIPITITLSTPSQSASSVTVSSDNPSVLLGRQTAAGRQSLQVTVPAGATSFTTFAQSSASSGTATITATAGGYNSGTATVTLTPSGFVIAGPNGVGASFNMNQGATAPLTISAAQLDTSGNFGQIEQISGGSSAVSLTLSNSNSAAGSVSPASVSIAPGNDSATSQFTAASNSTASTLVTVSTPAGFSTPVANSVAISVQPSNVTASSVTVGHGLETTANVTLQGVAQTDLNVVLTSNDPSKVLLSLDGVSAGQSSITTKIGAGRNRTLDFYVYGVGASGTSGYTATVDGFPSTNGLVTIANSGFILSGPFGIGADFFTTTLSDPSEIDVFTAVLDGSGNPTDSQAIAGGTTVTVNLTSSLPGVGTITSPVTFTGGMDEAISQFQPKSVGTTLLSALAPAGYNTPAQSASLHANVSKPRVVVQNIDVLGNNLEVPTTLFLSAPAPAGGVTVMLTSSDSGLLQFSNTAAGAGTPTLQVFVPAGNNGANFFLYGKSGTGSPTYSATAPGYDSTSASVNLASSGVIIYGPSGPNSTANQPAFEFDTSVGAGPSPLSVSTAVLDGTGNFVQTQALQGGPSVSVSVTSGTPTVGTVTSPVTITPGNDTASSTFTPVASGQTIVSIARPLNFSPSSNNTSILVKVQ